MLKPEYFKEIHDAFAIDDDVGYSHSSLTLLILLPYIPYLYWYMFYKLIVTSYCVLEGIGGYFGDRMEVF